MSYDGGRWEGGKVGRDEKKIPTVPGIVAWMEECWSLVGGGC